MATSAQHEALYATLRATVLARHFAVGRWFRANMLSLWNVLQEPPPGALAGLAAVDQERVRRWSVATHGRENPLLDGSKLLGALAIEYSLGNRAAAVPLARGIETIAALFPVRSGEGGWPIRWDPIGSDDWKVGPDGPTVCREFLIGDDSEYQYCIPATDPRRSPWRSLETLRALLPRPEADAYQASEVEDDVSQHWLYFKRHQVWECSMDEIAGLVGGLTLAHRLAGLKGAGDVRRAVVTPARLLGEYLADNGYLGVRPCGGFNARGATGALPAMELPIGRALGSITHRDLSSRVDFHGALERAGYARNLDGPIRGLVAEAIAGSLVVGPLVAGLAVLAPLVGGPLGVLAGTAIEEAVRLIGPVQIGTAAALYLHRDCFDVSNDAGAREVAVAYLLKEFEPSLRYRAWIAAMRIGGGYARGFPPHLALSALDDPDETVPDAYLALFRAERARGAPASLEPGLLDSAQATAVAILHGATEFEPLLLEQLDERFDRFAAEQDEPIVDGVQNIRLAVDYLEALALAWLHASRSADAGAPVRTAAFPVPPTDFSVWPTPAVPGVVLERLPEVRRVVLGDRAVPQSDVDLFAPGPQTRRASPPPPQVPSTGSFLGAFRYDVPERARDVFTGIVLEWGDEYEIDADGEIWGGVALTGSNGPEGWSDRLVDDARWPLHTGLDPVNAHPFALLARVGGWFYVGPRMARRRFLRPAPAPLHLRINCDLPGNGSGEFNVTVRLWGRPRQIIYPSRTISCATRVGGRIERVGGAHVDGSQWELAVSEAVEWVERYGHEFTVGSDEGPRVRVRRLGDRAFLRSDGDRSRLNNLRTLPFCRPAPR